MHGVAFLQEYIAANVIPAYRQMLSVYFMQKDNKLTDLITFQDRLENRSHALNELALSRLRFFK